MLIVNTPWKDASFGTLYGNWDEAPFSLYFTELMIVKVDDNTFTCYGFFEAGTGITNKFEEMKKGEAPYPVKFTLHGAEYQTNVKKGNDWAKETRQPTYFERLLIHTIKQNDHLFLVPNQAVMGMLKVVMNPILVDMWEFKEKNPGKEFPPALLSIAQSYPLADFKSTAITLLRPYLGEIQKAATESTGTKKAYQAPVDKLKKIKEIYAEYMGLAVTDVDMLVIRGSLLEWVGDNDANYDVFLKLAEIILK